MSNLLLQTDSYKLSHYKQYPKGTQIVRSYLESRGGQFDRTLFFGLQYLIQKHLMGQVVTAEKIDEAERFAAAHFGNDHCFNRKGWEHILNKHDGVLPIKIKAVPEGTVVPVSNVLMTIENTDHECYWLPNYLETLLVRTWYPITVATQSMFMKKVITEYLTETGDDSAEFKLHDFGYRGVSSEETAGIGGAAHLVNFMGSDTIAGIMLANKYYDIDMSGFSIPASEHSTITSWGKENEVEAMRNMLTQYPTGLVACVSDSFDIIKACTDLWGGELKNAVLERDGVLVVRPDSGHPPTIVVDVLEALGGAFGYTTNSKGYKVLNPKVRVIQGDGIDYEMLEKILYAMKVAGWSADNIAFGSGGGLLQKLDRDTQKFAFKCSSIQIDDMQRNVYKDPVTDPGKKSKMGSLRLARIAAAHGSYFETLRQDEYMANELEYDVLETVFINGSHRTRDFQGVRERASLNYAFREYETVSKLKQEEVNHVS
jgi:nicotinamide phosphoribosyltransferase